MTRIYLDHNATTPIDARVLAAMSATAAENFGNPSSMHHFGQQARAALEHARAQVAALIGAQPAEIVFTASGTEADNHALRGVLAVARAPRNELVHASIEHHAVIHTARALAQTGHVIRATRCLTTGRIDLENLDAQIGATTALVSLMLANNETGVIQPVEQAARLAHQRGALLHCDAVQAVGKIPVAVARLDVDLLSLSAHKFNGPKGVGALYVKRGTAISPLLWGGAQERQMRAGTENIVGIVGLGLAAEIAQNELDATTARITLLRDRLEERLLAIPGARRNGEEPRVPNTCNISFEHVDAGSLLMALDLAGLAVSTGAACAAGSVEPSHVLRAMGLERARMQGSLRFSLGRPNTKDEIDQTVAIISDLIEKQRARKIRRD
ncbi:MAG: cysteine desulfurase [Vicinamibacteria bacterium]|jgi:cysteine desulfurase|nr:cysteine desulfurase [Vicinamibacteria bacterium]